MLQGHYLAVLEARDIDEFRSAVLRFTQDIGFNTVSAVTVVEQHGQDADFIAVGNAPAGYEEAHHRVSDSRRDPVMQHLKRQSVPLVWSQDTYLKTGVGDLWEEQAAFGYRTGVAMALHLPEGKHFLLGVDRDLPLPEDKRELTRIVADLQLFAVHAQDTALRILVPPSCQPERPALTVREVEALKWTMEGKTAWEVGTILGISQRTAVMHINNAMHKLDCATKHQAVLKALRLGLIH
ncbi:MAG: autoinducer binding domain-containing protein [Aquincola sp.]|uniref:helix-turn-helix transcriptional regulator n=1 Tax=uncultured Aquincola sp. TaxID=886556 RepID=UPI0032B26652|nr:autoinducer binding domain-containing protein [Aquincola sp.]